MSSTVTLSQLTTRARKRADMSESQFLTDAAIQDYLQSSAKALYELVLTAWGDDYYYSTYSFSTVPGTAAYALPSDFRASLGVDATVPGLPRPATLQKFLWEERNRYDQTTGWSTTTVVPRYRLRSGNIWFVPTPQSVHTVTLHYVPVCPTLNDSTNLFDGVNGWDEWIVIDTAIKMLTQEESDTSALEVQLARKTDEIQRSAPVRDIGKPQRATDVYASLTYGWDDM